MLVWSLFNIFHQEFVKKKAFEAPERLFAREHLLEKRTRFPFLRGEGVLRGVLILVLMQTKCLFLKLFANDPPLHSVISASFS